MWGEIMGC